jgi:hypothetical protein
MENKVGFNRFVVALPQLMLVLLFGADARQVESKSNSGEPKSFANDFRDVRDPWMGSPACPTVYNEMNCIQDIDRKDGQCFWGTKDELAHCDGVFQSFCGDTSAGVLCPLSEVPTIKSATKDLLLYIKTAPEPPLSDASKLHGWMDGAGTRISRVGVTSAAGSTTPYLGWVLIIVGFVFLELCRACCNICRFREELATSKPASRDLNVPSNDTSTSKLDDTDMSDVHLETQ